MRRPVRRSPLINRGYYVRIAAVDLIISRFLTAAWSRGGGTGRAQIVSLGAGVDTGFWRHAAGAAALSESAATSGQVASGLPNTLWVEIDFPSITSKKAEVIACSPTLRGLAAGRRVAASEFATAPVTGGVKSGVNHEIEAGISFAKLANGGTDVSGDGGYRLVTADLRDISGLRARVTAAGVDPSVPTLLLSECVLVYLEPEDSCAVIAWAARHFTSSVFVTYEQVRSREKGGK